MNYLFIGEDALAKDAKINQIKQKLFGPVDHSLFDYEVLYANKLDAESLKKCLLNLPGMAQKRLVVIREGHQLSPQNQEILLEILSGKPDYLDVILDSFEWDHKTAFVKKIARLCQIEEVQSEKKLNVFDMTREIEGQNSAQALKILDQLITTGNHPLQIMGGLVWFWGKSRNRLSPVRFERGLLAMQEADLNIKRSRLKPEYALEMLIVKLCSREV